MKVKEPDANQVNRIYLSGIEFNLI